MAKSRGKIAVSRGQCERSTLRIEVKSSQSLLHSAFLCLIGLSRGYLACRMDSKGEYEC